MNEASYYSELIKPFWAPPTWLFGPVWTVLYILIFIFTPIQFGLKNNILASVDILLVLGTLIWALWAVRPHFRWVLYVNIPYLLWGSFATILQLTITYLNR